MTETEEVGKILDKIGVKVIDVRWPTWIRIWQHIREWCVQGGPLHQNVWIKQWTDGFTCDLWPNNKMGGMELLERIAEEMPWFVKLLAEPMK